MEPTQAARDELAADRIAARATDVGKARLEPGTGTADVPDIPDVLKGDDAATGNE